METARLILLVIHILGFAALIGGLLAQAGQPDKTVNGAMRDGIGTAFLAGIALTGVLAAVEDDGDVNYPKIWVKFGIGLVLLVLVMANVRKDAIPKGLWAGLLVLAVANVCIAVLWSPAHT